MGNDASTLVVGEKLHNYIKRKATLAQKQEDVLNNIDLVNKG